MPKRVSKPSHLIEYCDDHGASWTLPIFDVQTFGQAEERAWDMLERGDEIIAIVRPNEVLQTTERSQ